MSNIYPFKKGTSHYCTFTRYVRYPTDSCNVDKNVNYKKTAILPSKNLSQNYT